MAKAAGGKRKTRRKLFWPLALLVLIAGAGAYAYFNRPWEPKPLEVAAEVMERGAVSQVLAVNGRVAAIRSVDIKPTVQAQVTSVGTDVGDTVSEGQLLAQLDASQPSFQVDQAQAALEAGQARRDQQRANLERARALGENITRATIDNAETEFRAAENEVSRLQALLKQAEDLLSQYAFHAPFDGVVLERTAEEGQIVNTQSLMFTIADLSELVVETDVDELYSSQIQTGLAALLKPAGSTGSRDGTVSFAAPTVDPATGGRAIKISFDEPVSLPIGLTVNANIIVSQSDDALSIPRTALITEGSGAYVWVIEDGLAARHDVSFIDWPADRLEVTEGLLEGDVVIIEPGDIEAGDLVAPLES